MRKIFIFLGIAKSIALCAQENIQYDKLLDDPNFLFHIKGGVFGDADFYDSKNYRGGIYAGAMVNLGNRLAVGGDIHLGLSRWNRPQKESVNPLGGNHLDVSGRLIFNFSSQEDNASFKTNLKVTSYRSGNYNITDTKYIMVTARRLQQFGLTGTAGFLSNQINVNKRKPYELEDSALSIKGTGIGYMGAYISGGLSIRSYVNFLIDAKSSSSGETYKRKGKREHRAVYLEGLYMPVVLIPKELNLEDGPAVLKETPPKQNLGFRIISEYHSTGTLLSGARMEIGMRPGIRMPVSEGKELTNLYIRMSVFVGINAKAKGN